MASKKIMILGASILQLPAIRKAKEMGLQVIAVDMNPEAIGFQEIGVIREVISTIDIPAVVRCAKKHRVDGVMTLASDMPMRTVAAVSRELHLVGPSEETALKATNKACMRDALKQGGVPIPSYYKVSSRAEYEKAVKNFTVPFVVKPADNSGSRGIVRIGDLKDKETISEAYEYSKSASRSGDIVVEEYMDGPEVSVETMSVDGVCRVIQITDKITTGAPHFVEMGHTQPSRLDPVTRERIAEVAKQANRAVGITNGPSHTEIIITREGPKVVELGARLGGDCITTHLVPLSTGVDMVKGCIDLALGEVPDMSVKYSKGAAIRYMSCSSGRIVDIAGVEDARSADGVEQVSIVHDVGDIARNIQSSSDRVGFVIARGEDATDAAQKCASALARIEISVKDGCL